MSDGLDALSSKRRWQALTIGTVLLVPAFWALLAGLVASATAEPESAVNPFAALAFGIAIVPFVFLAVAIASSHRNVPGAVLGAMGLALLVGAPASALAGDAVTGIIIGVGAGAVIALRHGPEVSLRARAVGVLAAGAYAFVLLRTVGSIALLAVPVFPLTAVGFADELVLWWRSRSLQPAAASDA